MKQKQIIYLITILFAGLFLSACGGGNATDKSDTGTQKMSGAEILQDAKNYADQQCKFKRRELLLKYDPDVKDYDQKMNDIKIERKRLKNYYMKKYANLPEERVAFQRAVKAARQDSEFCKNMPKRKIKL